MLLFDEIDPNNLEYANILQNKLREYTMNVAEDGLFNLGNYTIKLTNPNVLAQTLFIIRELIKAFRSDTIITVRDVYYMNVELLKSTVNVSNKLKKIATFLGLIPTDLPILPSLKGLCYGASLIRMEDGSSCDCNSQPILIPLMQKISEAVFHGKLLLIVEKDAVFQYVVQKCQNGELNNMFIVTGKGFPDKNTQLFVKEFANKFTSVHVLVDMDPHGLCIYKTYFKQDPQVRFTLMEFKISALNSTALSGRDFKMLTSLFQLEETRFIAQQLFFMGCKYEIEQMDQNDILEYLKYYTDEPDATLFVSDTDQDEMNDFLSDLDDIMDEL